jgi:hypothetical protein
VFDSSSLLLVGAVAAVGILHTVVPDHWVPITLIARQYGWSRTETARASLQAGVGHVLSTLAIALVVGSPVSPRQSNTGIPSIRQRASRSSRSAAGSQWPLGDSSGARAAAMCMATTIATEVI